MNSEELAGQLMGLAPRLMNHVRAEIAAGGHDGLTFPQFRVLANIRRGLSQVGRIADHHGVSQPAISKMVEGLVQRGWVKRQPSSDDRRHVQLILTKRGEAQYHAARAGGVKRMTDRFKKFSARDRERLVTALTDIEKLILTEGKGS